MDHTVCLPGELLVGGGRLEVAADVVWGGEGWRLEDLQPYEDEADGGWAGGEREED